VTTWAERTELFMEFPPLIVGREARFAAHVTEMPTFRAVTSGRATLTVIYAGGAEVSGAVDAPSNPGIFRPVLTPSKAGPCELRFTTPPPGRETFAAGPCEVLTRRLRARSSARRPRCWGDRLPQGAAVEDRLRHRGRRRARSARRRPRDR
jgi:hypothetical protein